MTRPAPRSAPGPAPRTALVTGSAGFIGMHLCRRLLDEGLRVVGLDAMTDYYDVGLKTAREARLLPDPAFRAVRGRVETPGLLRDLMADTAPDIVVHLAAQAGVRHSIDNPRSYLDANIAGTFELLEAARAHPPAHMLLASTSSAYGANTAMPYGETDRADHQMSFYAATKKAGEAMAHSYAHLYGLPVTMFRFFTVYGPWGRPDMALFKFVDATLKGRAIDVYNHGRMRRDFTHVDDLVEGIWRLVDTVPPRPVPETPVPPCRDTATATPPVPDVAMAPVPDTTTAPVPDTTMAPVPGDSLSPVAPFRVVNIGNGAPVELGAFIDAVEAALGMPVARSMLDMQPGDVPATWADTALLRALTGYAPATKIGPGVASFVDWYRAYYGVADAPRAAAARRARTPAQARARAPVAPPPPAPRIRTSRNAVR